MAQVVLAKETNWNIDGSIQKAFFNFISKLSQDHTAPGLRVKQLTNAVDKRVRTARVNDDLRAVLFVLEGGDEPIYLLHGVFPHDEGNDIASRVKVNLSPINGQFYVTESEEESAGTAPLPAGVTLPSAYTADADLSYSWLGSFGYNEDNLNEWFGLPTDVGRRALAAQTAEQLFNHAESCVGWIQSVLLQLAVGDSKDAIIEQLSLISPETVPSDVSAEPTDKEIVAALQTDLAKSEYTFVDAESEEELRTIIESGTFGQWRRFLHPEQRRYVTATANGAFRLSGAAGTGKTVVLLHRANEMARKNKVAKVILTTYNRTLAEGLEEQLLFLNPKTQIAEMGEPGVCVAGVDALAHRALRNAKMRGNMERLNRAMEDVLGGVRPNFEDRRSQEDTHNKWANAVARAGVDTTPVYLDPEFLRREYEEVILPQRITTEKDYLRARRTGRGYALNRRQRRELWKVVEDYRAEALVAGGLSFTEAAAVASQLMRRRIDEGDPHYADHVLVDEGQDLSAVQWQFLRGLVPAGQNDLFIAEDSEQRIYGRQLVLSHFGIPIVGRSRRLVLNYRTTAENLRRAVRELEGKAFVELDGEEIATRNYRSARRGPEPVEVSVSSREAGIREVVERVQGWEDEGGPVDLGAIGVLTRYRSSAEKVMEALINAGIAARVVTRAAADSANKVQAMTMHRAKGLEFARVIVLFERFQGRDDEGADLAERSLAYVAMTRARDELVIVEVA